MKISARDEYACAAVLELSLNHGSDMPVRVQDIAQRQGIPAKFLFQIMQILKRVDIVRSRRGTEGGYTLTRPPGQIMTKCSLFRSIPIYSDAPDPRLPKPVGGRLAAWAA